MDKIREIADALSKRVDEEGNEIKSNLPSFHSGDTVTVSYKIKEGNKERIQEFKGIVIQRRGSGASETFTIRKMSGGVGVERIFPVRSPFIGGITVTKEGKTRRARIFYLRNLTGKAARIKEKKHFSKQA